MTDSTSDKEELEVFRQEAIELLDECERHLMALEAGEALAEFYDAVFRIFHSIKGAASMVGMVSVSEVMHKLETDFVKCRDQTQLSPTQVSYFLEGLDLVTRGLSGETVQFTATLPDADKLPTNEPPSKGPADSSAQPESEGEPIQKEITKIPGPTPQLSGKYFEAQENVPPTVFLVDDEDDVAEAIAIGLETLGIVVRRFNSPHACVDAVREAKPDIIVSDFKMPEMNGLQLLDAVRKIDPEMLVICITGYADTRSITKMLNSGLYYLLEKPFKVEVLGQVIHRARSMKFAMDSLNEAINLIILQFSDLSDYLQKQGSTDLHESLNNRLKNLLHARRRLRANYRALDKNIMKPL